MILYMGLGAVVTLAAVGFWFLQTPVFGGSIGGQRLTRIRQSPNYAEGAFRNLEATQTMRSYGSVPRMLWQALTPPADVSPSDPLPVVQTDLHALARDTAEQLVWFGHSSYWFQVAGRSWLVDPVFSPYASPLPIFGKAFAHTYVYSAADIPDVDVLVLTHDHYDHLDQAAIQALAPRVGQFVVPLGVGAHLERWGVSPERIVELDWWQSWADAGTQLTLVPMRHFSGRGLSAANTLWGGYVLATPTLRLLLGGDSGYGRHFAEIGAKYGPFDLAILECGQYGTE